MASGGKAALVAGSQGFVGSYVCTELLGRRRSVVGVVDCSKYGPPARPHGPRPSFQLVNADCLSDGLRSRFLEGGEAGTGFDYAIAGADIVGGIAYFHRRAYDLLAANERMLASTLDTVPNRRRRGLLDRIVVVSSSMMYENATVWPNPEAQERGCPAPSSAYGFQRPASERFTRAARAQHGLPYAIVRVFNCVCVAEGEALGEKEAMSGSVRLFMSHVVPDLARKCLLGQDLLHIVGSSGPVRHYTNGRDVARGIRMAMESERAAGEDFNISAERGTAVMELARMVWERISPGRPFLVASDSPYEHDMQRRAPDTGKARRVLGFEAEVGLGESLDEVAAWLRGRRAGGGAGESVGKPAPEGEGG